MAPTIPPATSFMHLAPGKNPRLWASIAGLLVIAIPVLIALQLAAVHSRKEQERHVALLASEVLNRSEQVSTQIVWAESLLTEPSVRPCSPRHLQLMARMTAEMPFLIALGHIEQDRLLCSTFGLHGSGLPVGPPEFRSRLGRDIRPAVPLPGITEHKLLLTTEPTSGYTAIIHPDVPVNIQANDPSLSVGVYSPSSLRALSRRGLFDPAWHERLGTRSAVQFFDGQHVVAIQRSEQYDYAAYAAITVEHFDRGTACLMLLLVPLGIGAGFILALIVFRYTQHRLSMLWHFRRALRREELFLVYQPVVDLASGRWVGAEALLRWRQADGTLVPPDVFIAMAERNHLINQVTARVIQLFIRDLHVMLRQRPDFHISVNFSASDLERLDLARKLHETVTAADLQPGQIQVEATERGLLNTDQTRSVLQYLRTQGMRIAIDDFGTGYSSLSYLTTLEVDSLKIDKSFVETIGTDAATSQVVAHIIEMAKSLRLKMIAEGVETQDQADYLRAHGVQYAQGWLFARPLTALDLIRGLEQQEVASATAHP